MGNQTTDHFPFAQGVGIKYGFGHLASAEAYPDDAHAGDSRDLADDTFDQLGLTDRERALLTLAAEWYAEVVQGSP